MRLLKKKIPRNLRTSKIREFQSKTNLLGKEVRSALKPHNIYKVTKSICTACISKCKYIPERKARCTSHIKTFLHLTKLLFLSIPHLTV